MGVVVTTGYSKYIQRAISTFQRDHAKVSRFTMSNVHVGLSELLGSNNEAELRKLGLYQHSAGGIPAGPSVLAP